MNKENQQKLAKRFPTFFRKGTRGLPEHGDGWFHLLWKLCEEVEVHLVKNPALLEAFHFTCLKEKFSELRVYVHGGDEAIQAMTDRAEQESVTICEACGSTEDVLANPDGGWWACRCVACWDACADEAGKPRFAASKLASLRELGMEPTFNAQMHFRR